MCRTGGRRCPSTHDSQAVASRNARRRAAYAAARKADGKSYSPRAGEAFGVTEDTVGTDENIVVIPNPLAVRPPEPISMKAGIPKVGVHREHPYDWYLPVGTKFDVPNSFALDSMYYKDQYDLEEVQLKRPLIVEHITSVGQQWREKLSSHYDNKIGDALAAAIVQDGYDSVVTYDNSGHFREGLDLTQVIPLTEEERNNEPSWVSKLSSEEFSVNGSYVDEELGITITNYGGSYVDLGVFAKASFSGKPNWENLDDESYKKFGFTEPPTEYELINASDDDDYESKKVAYSASSAKENSKIEIDNVESLRNYTSEMYNVINKSLVSEDGTYDTSSTIVKHISNIDDHLANNASGQQRIVYRGTNFRKLGIDLDSAQIGAELQFDTFQSSSLDESVALSFTPSNEGVMLEISTPEGVNIKNLSTMKTEVEVLLPRGAKYVVVGKHSLEMSVQQSGNVVLQLVAVNSKGEVLDGTNSDPIPKLPNLLDQEQN